MASAEARLNLAAGVDKNIDISNKRKEVDMDVECTAKRTKVYAEGVLLLGPDPPYRMKLFPVVTVSTRLQKMIASEDFGERNLTIELSACPGDHCAFKIVESFSYGLTTAKDVLISHAAELFEVCDFLDLTTVSDKVWLIIEEHFRSGLTKELTDSRKELTTVRTKHNVWLIVEKHFRSVLTIELTDLRKELYIVRTKHNVLENTLKNSICELANATKDLVGACQKADAQDCDLEKAKKALVSASNKFNTQARELETAKNDLVSSCNKLNTQACELDMANKDLKTVRAEHDVQTKTLKTTKRELSKAKKEVTGLCHEFNVQHDHLQKAKKDLVSSCNKVDAQETDLKEIRDKLEQKERDVEEEKETTLCQICMGKPRDTLCFPCLHFLYCFTCLSEHKERGNRTCPACRGFLSGFLQVFLSCDG